MSWLKRLFGREHDAGLFESSPLSDKAIRVIDSQRVAPMRMCPGDNLHVRYAGSDGPKEVTYRQDLKVKKEFVANRVTVIEIRDALGFDVGVGLLVGGESE